MKKDNFALFAYLFRLHMIRTIPKVIWVDTSVYCYRPMDCDSDYVMGFELLGEHRINNVILGLPADNPMLSAKLIRARRDFPRYQRELFNRAIDAGHTELAKKLGHFILSKNDNRAIRRAMKNMT